MEKQVLRNAKSLAITGTSAKLTAQLKSSAMYRIVGDVDFWYVFGDATISAVAAAAEAIFVPAGSIVFDSPVDPAGKGLAFFHAIRSAVSGTVNVAEVQTKGDVDEGSA
jgi:hypothetical protein